MKFFKSVLGDLFSQRKTNRYQLKVDVSKYGSTPSFRRKLEEETRQVTREKSLELFKER
ncbi:hypothetical protein [Anaplasma platys]|uniref:hypothetical protein n=1 Tax=Anaplasma platys TaxID=949 RepID=UPI00145DD5AB|nr:hypothetical protein [Anaplasma platys]